MGQMSDKSDSKISCTRDGANKLVVAMVGLPARGKSYIATKIATYLNWLDTPCRVFNVGSYRRKFCGIQLPSNFFDPANLLAETERMKAAEIAMQDLVAWMKEDGGKVAIYDATNSTKWRRDWIREVIIREGFQIFFFESICNNQQVILLINIGDKEEYS
jgi:6-phosphofructo-2-kinase / fructose-2,6-biphosphatase 2